MDFDDLNLDGFDNSKDKNRLLFKRIADKHFKLLVETVESEYATGGRSSLPPVIVQLMMIDDKENERLGVEQNANFFRMQNKEAELAKIAKNMISKTDGENRYPVAAFSMVEASTMTPTKEEVEPILAAETDEERKKLLAALKARKAEEGGMLDIILVAGIDFQQNLFIYSHTIVREEDGSIRLQTPQEHTETTSEYPLRILYGLDESDEKYCEKSHDLIAEMIDANGGDMYDGTPFGEPIKIVGSLFSHIARLYKEGNGSMSDISEGTIFDWD